MNEILLNPKKTIKRKIILSKIKRKILKHIWLVRIGLIILLILSCGLALMVLGRAFSGASLFHYPRYVLNFILTPAKNIKSFEGRTNILILGKGGEGHEAPDLTDTIIFASIGHTNPSITLVSLPRDIWITELRTKLNSIYYWGNQKEQGGGMILAKSVVEEIVGVPIQYALVLDFAGFKDLIDTIDGIEIKVERGFIDQKYPIAGKEDDFCGGDRELNCRYETIEFKEGRQKMDGETALKFVRSRNAEGDEGTDLAREARQQKVLLAIKNKILDPAMLFQLRKLIEIQKVLNKSVETDVDDLATSILTRRIFQGKDNLETFVLPEDLLFNPKPSSFYDNLYVFVPKDESWQRVQEWIKQILD